jgi:ankyrin repeat protein
LHEKRKMIDVVGDSLLRDLVYAAEHGDSARVATLLDLGLKPDRVDAASGKTALFAAACGGQTEIVRQLLAHVAHPDREEVFRTTPLAYVIHELGEGPAEPKRAQLVAVVRSLLEAGANPRGGSDRHQTPLGLAREYEMEDVNALLAEYIQG